MSDKQYDVDEDELFDDEEIDDVEEGHDPVNAAKNAVDSVDKAANTGPRAKQLKGSKTNGEKTAYKANPGIVRELFNKMNEMSADEIRKLHAIMMDENFSLEDLEEDEEEDVLEDVSYDFTTDLSTLVESEATLSEGFRAKAAVIMETAIKSKLKEEISRLEEAYETQLAEAVTEHYSELVEKIDGYLDYVVENWMSENKLAVQNGLRTEIAENFMTQLKDLFIESYIEVPEDKVDMFDDLAEQVESLNEELNRTTHEVLRLREENEEFKREGIVMEIGEGLADTQFDKFVKLSESVDFNDEDDFREKLSSIKEAYFDKKPQTPTKRMIDESVEQDVDAVEITDETMKAYVSAIRKKSR